MCGKCEKDFWNNFLKFIAKLGTSLRAESQQLSDTVEHCSRHLSLADRITWAESPRLRTNYSHSAQFGQKVFLHFYRKSAKHTHTHTRTVSFSSMLQCQGREQNRETKGIYCRQFIVHMLRKHKNYVQWHFAALRIVIVVVVVIVTVVAAAVKHLSQGQSTEYSQNSFWLMNYEWADDLYCPLWTVLCSLVAQATAAGETTLAYLFILPSISFFEFPCI